jgi:hypothetical protein
VIEELIDRVAARLESLRAAGDQRQYFQPTCIWTRSGRRWRAAAPTRPWEIAFGAPAGLPPLRHVLLGMNAHINYDLPQALLAVITDEEFGDPALLARRRSDHQAIDRVLGSRVAAEDDELASVSLARCC